jgi:hypothetical protein
MARGYGARLRTDGGIDILNYLSQQPSSGILGVSNEVAVSRRKVRPPSGLTVVKNISTPAGDGSCANLTLHGFVHRVSREGS